MAVEGRVIAFPMRQLLRPGPRQPFQ